VAVGYHSVANGVMAHLDGMEWNGMMIGNRVLVYYASKLHLSLKCGNHSDYLVSLTDILYMESRYK